MSTIGIGLIGTGFMGKAHAVAFNAVSAVFGDIVRPRLRLLCDVDPERTKTKAEEFGFERWTTDWREVVSSPAVDVVAITTPNHLHREMAVAALAAGKHVYCEKPMAVSLADAEAMANAAGKCDRITLLGYSFAKNPALFAAKRLVEEGMIGRVFDFRGFIDEDYVADPDLPWTWRLRRENAGLGVLGDITKVYCWTNRPVWPQGISWPAKGATIPTALNWDLWLGTAKETYYIDNLVPFNWRGWWEFGTGALGDMGCHIIGPPFKLLQLGYPTEITASASTVYNGIFKEGIYPESGPVSSWIRFLFKDRSGRDIELHWMDGGIVPERPAEIDPTVDMNEALADWPGENDYEGGTLFIGTKGKASCGWGGSHPRLLPMSRNQEVQVPQKYPRIQGGMDGHWWQWIDASIAGYGNMEVDSPFQGYAGPLTETVLLGNLLLRSFNIREKIERNDPVYGAMGGYKFPGRYITYQWDGVNMKITNFEAANQFIRREYRQGWGEVKL